MAAHVLSSSKPKREPIGRPWTLNPWIRGRVSLGFFAREMRRCKSTWDQSLRKKNTMHTCGVVGKETKRELRVARDGCGGNQSMLRHQVTKQGGTGNSMGHQCSNLENVQVVGKRRVWRPCFIRKKCPMVLNAREKHISLLAIFFFALYSILSFCKRQLKFRILQPVFPRCAHVVFLLPPRKLTCPPRLRACSVLSPIHGHQSICIQ